jgi:hypothetical protein
MIKYRQSNQLRYCISINGKFVWGLQNGPVTLPYVSNSLAHNKIVLGKIFDMHGVALMTDIISF